jgi:hypothetical protein
MKSSLNILLPRFAYNAMITHVTTPATSASHCRVFNEHGDGFEVEGVQEAPDFSEIIDSFSDRLQQAIQDGTECNIRDLSVALFNEKKRELLCELLVKLLALLIDSKDIKLDLNILIAASDLKIVSANDSAVAKSFGISRQTFSARKRALLKKLGMNPPQHSKSAAASEVYKLTNRKPAASSD